MGTNQVVGTTVIPNGGEVSAYFGVPVLPRGAYTVTVTANADTQTSPPPDFVITPQIFLGSFSGHIGDHFVISSNGFAANTGITIYFNGAAQTPSASIYTDSLGQFANATITILSSYGGNHNVTAADYAGTSPAAIYCISSSMTLSAHTGAVGSSFTVSGSGFAPNSTLSFFFDNTPISARPAPVQVVISQV